MKKTINMTAIVLALIAILNFAPTANAYANIYEATCFELELYGTTGYGVIDLVVRAGDSNKSAKLGELKAGQAFTILAEGEKYFEISFNGASGYVYKNYTMVNLPDLLPSIVYDATNSYDSQYTSGGYELANTTHKSLYTGKTWNAKLGYEEYNMPVLYTMAKKLAAVQSAMKSDNKTLVLYEGFRPRAVQQLVNLELGNLMANSWEVSRLINQEGWGKSWFIAKGVSNHQKGYAVDISMATVSEFTFKGIDGMAVQVPAAYELSAMPTNIHELSPRAASLAYGVNSKSATAWTEVPNAKTMTADALALRTYCVNAGLSPLASEWWHFNDLAAMNQTGSQGLGQFEITGNVSVASK